MATPRLLGKGPPVEIELTSEMIDIDNTFKDAFRYVVPQTGIYAVLGGELQLSVDDIVMAPHGDLSVSSTRRAPLKFEVKTSGAKVKFEPLGIKSIAVFRELDFSFAEIRDDVPPDHEAITRVDYTELKVTKTEFSFTHLFEKHPNGFQYIKTRYIEATFDDQGEFISAIEDDVRIDLGLDQESIKALIMAQLTS